ncbi:hypothetical protein O4G76_19140, partial [Limimaricola sp. G21655-S1]|uniref:hypothetical protein n=1 Tax=Limimaricola sp. G21655-S1 TaxID=3014768 RepID=UPI0022AF3C54
RVAQLLVDPMLRLPETRLSSGLAADLLGKAVLVAATLSRHEPRQTSGGLVCFSHVAMLDVSTAA